MTQTNAKNEITLAIDSLSYGPYGIGRSNGRVVMVPLTAPGDELTVRLTESKERYAVGELVDLLKPSRLRQSPPCSYALRCGGCQWQHIQYEAQLAAKQKNVADALARIGKFRDFELRPIIPSSREVHYRRRIRLQTDRAKRLGFYGAASHDLVEIDSCVIADESLNRAIVFIRDWLGELHSVVDQVEIVSGDEPNQIVIAGQVAGEFDAGDEPACRRLIDETNHITGLILRGSNWRRVWGQTSITIEVQDDSSLAVEGDVFTQVNREGNQQVLRVLLQAGDFCTDDRVLELFCGAGNFTLAVGRRAREIVAIEGYKPAISSARRNSERTGLSNIRWLCAAVPAAVAKMATRRERYSKILLNPPRGGAKGLDRDLASFGAETILYVSCNPTTLARDLSALARHGYKLKVVQPFDLFPHTFHVESLAVMVR